MKMVLSNPQNAMTSRFLGFQSDLINTGSCPVTFWDQQASQLLGKTAPELKLLMNEGQELYDFPDELETVVGKRLLIKLKRNDYNIAHPHCTISALEFSICQDLLPQFNNVASEELPQPDHGSPSDAVNDRAPVTEEAVTLLSDSDDIPIAQLPRKERGKRRTTSTPQISDASGFTDGQASNESVPRIRKTIKQEKKD